MQGPYIFLALFVMLLVVAEGSADHFDGRPCAVHASCEIDSITTKHAQVSMSEDTVLSRKYCMACGNYSNCRNWAVF
jgi:hypothetical protein